MFTHKYLTNAHLKGFDNYKYSAVDTSPLSNYVMHPFWNATVKFIPKSIAPNLLTFLGFMCVVAVAAMTFWYDYDWFACGGRQGHQYNGQCEIPNYVFTIGSVLIFLAYNLDGIDGKQARRLGVSGPLGEMFDHGLDSYIVFLIPFSLFSIFGRDEFSVPLFRGYLILASVILNFYVTHCEKYITRVLYLPWGYDVAMWAAVILFLVAGVFGPGCFKTFVFGEVTFAQALELAIHATGLFTTLPVSIYNVYLSYRNRTGNSYSLSEAVRPLWSICSMVAVMTYWGLRSHNVMESYPRAFLLLFGTLFSNIASRLIVAEMSGQRCEMFNGLLWPLAAGVAASLYIPALEWLVLHSLLWGSIFAHIHYGTCVVRQMCTHFKVKCFVVPKTKRK
ncbi:ethanolaminephosphotransferase 1-like [Battus philenor]|uniref:ethanolaminephosphotransferase 1-like n=1 Tax=Battus philenor TaxID=42288 RepID=UPI0035D1314B